MLIKFPLHQISSLLCLLAPTNDLPALIISCSRYLLTCKGSGGSLLQTPVLLKLSLQAAFPGLYPISQAVALTPSNQCTEVLLQMRVRKPGQLPPLIPGQHTASGNPIYVCNQDRFYLSHTSRDQAKSQSGKAKLEKLANDMEQFMALAYHLRTSPLGWINYFPEKQELETVRRS